MTAAKRRTAVTRRVNLADFGDGMDECYAVVTLADFEEVTAITAEEESWGEGVERIKHWLELARKHFVSGRILLLNADNVPELGDMQKDDIAATPGMIRSLYLTIMGVTLDPKATPTMQPSETVPTNDESSTKTLSCTDSVQTSNPA